MIQTLMLGTELLLLCYCMYNTGYSIALERLTQEHQDEIDDLNMEIRGYQYGISGQTCFDDGLNDFDGFGVNETHPEKPEVKKGPKK